MHFAFMVLQLTQMPVMKLDGSGRRILVIDDDLAIRVLLQAVLRRMHFDVELAEDGAAGLDRLQENEFDLVLLDLMMPRLNGYEFIQRVGERYADDARPHIVVFTAAGKRGVDKIPPELGGNSIPTPSDLRTFVELSARCVNGGHQSVAGRSGSTIRPAAACPGGSPLPARRAR